MSEDLGAGPVRAQRRDRASLTVLTGDGAGLLIRFEGAELVVGRGRAPGVCGADPSVSRLHARFFERAGRIWVEDLGSTNGTFVGGKRIVQPVTLEDGDHVQLGAHRVLRFNLSDHAEEEAAVQLYESSVRDPTSGAYDRRHFEARLQSEQASAEQRGTPLALLLLDVDEFKAINDSYGHPVGDSVLRVVAASIQRILRPEDTLARFGGDELVVLCRDTTARNARILADRIERCVARLPFSVSGNEFGVTLSSGVAAANVGEPNWGRLVQVADRALHRAKRERRVAATARE